MRLANPLLSIYAIFSRFQDVSSEALLEVCFFFLVSSIDVPSFYFESCPFMLLKQPL